jgi:UDP-glucose:(heptosyl)LPS alpha-1,3-glucosyltransferase
MAGVRIALLKSSFKTSGGLEKYCLRISQALREKGHVVDILSTASLPQHGVVSICSPIKPSFLQLLWFDYQCRRYLKKHRYDIVFGFDRHFLPLTHYRAGNGCHAAYLARRMSRLPFWKRALLRLNPLHMLTLLSERYTFEKTPPRYIICNSNLVRREILQKYPRVSQERLVVIHNGVEWGEIASHFESREKDVVNPRIVFIGNEWGRKGLERLLQALSFLKDAPFHCTAIGKERNPDRFVRITSSLGLQDHVTLIPRPTPAMPYLQSCNILVIPSLYDPFANVTVEALAMGLFVVTTTANGGGEIIQEGINGFVLDERCTVEDLSRAIRASFDIVKNSETAQKIRDSVQGSDFSISLKEYLRLMNSPLTQLTLRSRSNKPSS